MSAAEIPPPLERTLRVLPALLYLTFTWFASAETADEIPNLFVSDKLAHLGEYALLTLLLLFAFTAFDAYSVTAPRMALAALVSMAWAGLDEYHQSFVPTRDASGLDLVADAGGTVAALALVWFLAARERRP